MKNEFVDYLNNLHSYNAQNMNAYAEKSITSPYFNQVSVRVDLCDYILNILKGYNPQVIVLTGHAGDGKTSIMYQVLKDLGCDLNKITKPQDITLPNNCKCRCVKDFSELSDENKKEELKTILSYPEQGNFAFLVANTGPLINTYGSIFEENDEKYKSNLIDAMDQNKGVIFDNLPGKLNVINVALLDNTYFAEEFLNKVIQDVLWKPCSNCNKAKYCPIFRNYKLIKANLKTTNEFIRNAYIWIMEHNERLTIRSMTEHIAFMITGGLDCNTVKPMNFAKKSYFNLFFGYDELKIDKKALNILAISKINKCHFDSKKLRVDEAIIMKQDLTNIAPKEVHEDILKMYSQFRKRKGFNELIRRIYYFTNCETNKDKERELIEDVFSTIFPKYLEWRYNLALPSKSDARFIIDALNMIFTGEVSLNSYLTATFSRGNDLLQNVQLVIGKIKRQAISLESIDDEKNKNYNSKRIKKVLKLKVKDTIFHTNINLPLLNYFEELKNGIINTNIDPQLSHGIENLKSEISAYCSKDEDTNIELLIVGQKDSSPIIDIEDDMLKVGE